MGKLKKLLLVAVIAVGILTVYVKEIHAEHGIVCNVSGGICVLVYPPADVQGPPQAYPGSFHSFY
jgi:hypothetical protein